MANVSVIIPVYGVEKYIERCARSLFEQTLDNIEFIFIDDCSLDNSIPILKRVLKDYPFRNLQTRIERMPRNSGLAAVRKFGVSIATGEYFIACDSDDYVDKEMYEKMYKLAKEYDYDLVQCDIDLMNNVGVIRTLTSPKQAPTSGEMKTMIIEGDISNSLCNKLVKRSVYQNEGISFPVAGMDEDNTMACQLAYFSSSLGYIQEPYYKAYCNRASMSRRSGEVQIFKRYKESLSNSKIVVDFLRAHGYQDNSIAVIRAKIRPKNALWPIVKNRYYLKEWRNVFPEIDYKVLFNQRISLRIRIKFVLVLSRMVLLRH